MAKSNIQTLIATTDIVKPDPSWKDFPFNKNPENASTASAVLWGILFTIPMSVPLLNILVSHKITNCFLLKVRPEYEARKRYEENRIPDRRHKVGYRVEGGRNITDWVATDRFVELSPKQIHYAKTWAWTTVVASIITIIPALCFVFWLGFLGCVGSFNKAKRYRVAIAKAEK